MIFGLPYNTVIVLAGVSLLGVSAGVIGVFALLRRQALLGDATAHAGLPGVCLSFMLVGEQSMPALLGGALVAGLLGVAVLSALRRWTRLKEDTALALVLSVFYALGVVLLALIATPYWRGEGRSGLKAFLVGRTASMQLEDVEWLAGLALATILAVALLYKEFKLIAFDREFAQVQGWPVVGLDYLLNLLVVAAVVVGLPAVGVLMMAALLIIPAAAARFWSERLTMLLLLSGSFGLAGAVGGALLSDRLEVPTGPAIILVSAGLFVLSLVMGRRRGLLARALALRRFRQRLHRHQLFCRLHVLIQRAHTDRFSLVDLRQELKVHPQSCRGPAGEIILEPQGTEWVLTAAGKTLAEQAARRQCQAHLHLQNHPELATSLTTWFLAEDENISPFEPASGDRVGG